MIMNGYFKEQVVRHDYNPYSSSSIVDDGVLLQSDGSIRSRKATTPSTVVKAGDTISVSYSTGFVAFYIVCVHLFPLLTLIRMANSLEEVR
jgi:hypothetical protein